MKKFDNFKDAGEWVKKAVEKTKPLENISKQIYEDSKEFIYLDTEQMYESGADSPFSKGYVIIKAPQVRRLYYGTFRGRRNVKATPLWFVPTVNNNIGKYRDIYYKELDKELKK